jgi:TMEM175 potassium channel family protein
LNKSRVEAFSDGVFAVAITLLVLDLKVSGPGHGSLTHQLADEWPSYVAYVVSFMVIGIIWVNHHTLLGRFARIDRTLLFLNLLLLMFITVIPFPTSLFAQYLRAGGRDSHVAAALYGVVMEAMGLSFIAMFSWGGRHPELLRVRLDKASQRRAMMQFGLGSVVYILTIALAFVSAPAALVAHFAIAVFYIVDRTAVPGADAPQGSSDRSVP